ncbi:MAG: hypothetical protein FJZ98_04500 [Chloroflexi bacterium]|nr:hypothetical protein [Chloroflexota bacterium]
MNISTDQVFLGWSLLASGIVFILSFIFLTLMFTTRTLPWGPMNDISHVLALVLILPFMTAYYNELRYLQPFPALAALLFGGLGIGLVAYTQVGLVLRKIEFALNLRQGAFGAGLLGVAFIINHIFGKGLIPDGLNWLGFTTGILIAIGIPKGLFFGKEEQEMTTGKLDWKSANPLAVFSVLSTFLGQILLIILVFSIGFHLV